MSEYADAGLTNLSVAIIKVAIRDAKQIKCQPRRNEAQTWLSTSGRAGMIFDFLDIDRAALLEKLGQVNGV